MKIIANPNAGHGRGRAAIELLIRVLRRRDCDFDLRLTEAPLHATELAAELIRGGTGRIVVMGGDGTIGEVAKAVVGRDVEVGIISIGTGNDLARSLGLPRNDIEAAVSILDRGRVREIDLGREQDRTFVLMAGIGYPALVAEETNRMRRIKGPISYFAAVYKALARMRPFQAELVLDRQRLQLDCTSILVLNTPFCGGGQWMAPGASLEDGVLDVVVIGPVGRVDLMLNFPRVYRGTHISHPAFSVYRGARVEVRTRPPQGKMFDGDVAGETPLIAETIPKALKVVVAGE